MTTAEAAERRRLRAPVVAVTATAWALLVIAHSAPSGSIPATGGAPGIGGHGAHGVGALPAGSGPAASPLTLLGWLLMLVAMMAPLLLPALRHVHARSLPGRRRRSSALLALGYGAAWAAGSLLLIVVAGALRLALPASAAVGAAFAVATIWQFSPAKQRSLNRHHRHPPLAAFGRRADRDALRFGLAKGGWCFGSCWALMLLPLVAPAWQLALMALVSAWMWGESVEPPRAPGWRLATPRRAARIVRARTRAALQAS